MASFDFDVIIAGAGLMGSAAAYFLSKAGKKVLVLEQFHLLHSKGSSYGESRITRYTYPSSFYVALMTRAYRLWDEAEKESAAKVFEETGGIDILEDGPTAKLLQDACAEHGVEIEKLGPEEVLKRYGMVIPAGSIGIMQKNSGVLRATAAVAMLQGLAVKHGAVLRDHTKVVSAVQRPEGEGGGLDVTVEGQDGGKHTHSCAKLIVACGAWAQPMLERLFNVSIDLEIWQTSICYWRAKGEEGSEEYLSNKRKLEALPVFIDYGNDALWLTGGDRPLSGGEGAGAVAVPSEASTTVTGEKKPCIYSCPCTSKGLDYPGLIKIAVHHGRTVTADTRTFEPDVKLTVEPTCKWIASHLPFLDSSKPALAQTCLYSMTKDEQFIVDTLPKAKDVIVAAGFSGHGFKMGTVVGKMLAEMATGVGKGKGKGEDSDKGSSMFEGLGVERFFSITRPEVGYREL